MDLNTIAEVLRPASADAVKEWPTGHAWLAGGTWLFSEPQVTTDTLVDLEGFKWPSLRILPDGLEIAATCKVAELDHLTGPHEWKAAPLFSECCRAFLFPVDFTKFFFDQMKTNLRDLELEIHFLAKNYHWAESEILAMPRKKRKRYVSLLRQEMEL